MGPVLRIVLLGILILGVAGFGVCTLCGGVMMVGSLPHMTGRDADMFWTTLIMSSLGAVMTWLCWLGWRAVLKRGKPSDPPASDPP